MPWNEPGKNSNNGSNKGSKDPWGKGESQPPDLDEVFAKVQQRLSSLLGGKGGSGSRQSGDKGSGGGFVGLSLVAIIILAVWVVFTSPHVVDEAERGVVTRFGKFVRVSEPGLRFTWPSPIEALQTVDVSAVRSIQNKGSMLTSDENVIELAYSVQYRIVDPVNYVFLVRDPDEVLALATESAMREVIGANELDYILQTGRGAVGSDTRLLLQEILDSYSTGMQLTNFNLNDVNPPPQVKAAFDDVIKAEKDKDRYINEATAYANKVVPEARGQAARIVQEAEAYKASQIAQADGEASRFNLQLDAYRLAPDVTRQRLYLQTLEQVLGQNSKVLLDIASDGNILYLPIGSDNAERPLPPLRNAASPVTGFGSSTEGQANNTNDSRSRGRGREGR